MTSLLSFTTLSRLACGQVGCLLQEDPHVGSSAARAAFIWSKEL